MAALTWQEQRDASRYIREHNINQSWFNSSSPDSQRGTIYGGTWKGGKKVEEPLTPQQQTTQGLATRREEISQMGQGEQVATGPAEIEPQGWWNAPQEGPEKYSQEWWDIKKGKKAPPAPPLSLQTIGTAQDPGLSVTPGTTPSVAPVLDRREELQAQPGLQTFGQEKPWYHQEGIVAGQRAAAGAMPGFQAFEQETPWYKGDVAARRQKIGAMPGFQTFEEKAPWYQELMAKQQAGIGDYGIMRSFEEETPWYQEGEGGGVLGRRRAEVEGIDPGEMYALSAPSVRQTTDQIMANLKEEAARTGGSPSMMALMGKQDFGLAGLGAAAGQAASTAYSLKQQGLADLATMEASLSQTEMGARRAMSADRQNLLANLGTLEAQLGTAEMSERRGLQREKDRMLEDLFALESGLGQTEMAARRAQGAARDAALLDVGLLEAQLGTTEMAARRLTEEQRQAQLQDLTQWEATLTADEMNSRREREANLYDDLIDLAKIETAKETADADRRQELEIEKQRLLSDIAGYEMALSENMTSEQAANYRARLNLVMDREAAARERESADRIAEAIEAYSAE